MSKALLKKSLAFVRSGGCEDRERDVSRLKRRESTERKSVRKKASAKSRATNKSHLAPDKGIQSYITKCCVIYYLTSFYVCNRDKHAVLQKERNDKEESHKNSE